MTQRKIFNFESHVLNKETIDKFGYDPNNLGKTSIKFVIAICRFCGKQIDVRLGNFNKIGSACHNKCRLEQQKLQVSPFLDQNVREKAKSTNFLRFGTIHVSQNKDIRNKISLAKKERDAFRKETSDNKLDFIKSIQNTTNNISINYKLSNFSIDCFCKNKSFGIVFNNSLESSEKVLDYKTCQMRQRAKLDFCRSKNIRLMHIFEHQWINRKKQYINFIRSIIGINTNRVHARQCDIDNKPCKSFYENNHIQGYGMNTIKFFNLKYNDRIVASMTAGRHHRQNSQSNDIVLNRLVFNNETNVPGGSSKLFKYFKIWAKQEGYDRIISWSDNCWTEGNVYKVLCFDLEVEYGSDYFYYDTNIRSYKSKQSQRKAATGCPEGMTEREWCIERGLYRIWDCGKKKWVHNLV